MPQGTRAAELEARRSGYGDNVPLWFIAAFEDGKATPDLAHVKEPKSRSWQGPEPRRGFIFPGR